MTTGFYQSFEDRHRGSEEDIAKRLAVYQTLVDTLAALFPGSPALDLGCGRGEWLSMLASAGFDCLGVDTDNDMLLSCHRRRLKVEQTDALSSLSSSPDNHYSLITAFHLVEHIAFDDLRMLIKEAHRALCPGGVLILETPNPENPVIGSCYFYMDPTHQKPLPPALLKFAADYEGFMPSAVWRLNEPEGLRDSAPSLETVLKHSSPDYAVLAQKPGNTSAQNALKTEFEAIKGMTLEELTNRYDNQHREMAEHLEKKIDAEVEHMGAKLTLNLIDLDKRSTELEHALHNAKTELDMTKTELERSSAVLVDTRKLLMIHDEKIRSLALLTRLFQPLYRIATRSANRYHQVRAASRHRAFYQWQAVKLLKLIGLTERAQRKAESIGLNLDGTPLAGLSGPAFSLLHSSEPTGPLPQIAQALIRTLSTAQHSKQNRDSNSAPLKVCIEGHFSGSYSLASVNRALAEALLKTGQVELQLIPREGERTAEIHTAPEQALALLRPLIKTGGAKGDVALYHHFPVIEMPDQAQGVPILVFFWEESQVPETTIEQINQHYAGVLVTTWVVKKALIDSGCRRPIAIVPLPLEDNLLSAPKPAPAPPYKFLHVSSCFPRKGADVLLNAFNKILAQHQDAELVIKTFPNPHNTVEEQIEQRIEEHLRERVTLIMADYTAAEMESLYRSSHAMVLPSRGEGLNLPAIEASRFGLPVVTTGYGAHTDFLTGKGVSYINYRFAPSQSHVHTPGSLWVNPDTEDLVRLCNATLNQLRTGHADIDDTRQKVTESFFSERARTLLADSLLQLSQRAPNLFQTEATPSVTIMSTWGEACGIAEYSRYMALELMALNTKVHVWAPKHLEAPEIAPLADQLESIDRCWQPQTNDLPLHDLATSDQAIWIQHHPGFFNLDNAVGDAIANATRNGKLRFITLHATLPLLDLTGRAKLQTAATLNQFYRVVVHKPVDVNILKELGVTDNVAMLPQGVARLPVSPEPAANDKPFTVGCFGFLFPHKGVLELIEAFAEFRRRHPKAANSRLILLNSVHPTNDNSAEYRDLCERRLHELNLDDVCEFQSDFLDEHAIASKLQNCDLLVLPYRETPESSSGAVRTAVVCCPTVAVTPAGIFDEVREATLAIPGFDVEHIVQMIENVMTGTVTDEINSAQAARAEWIKLHAWPNAALKHKKLLMAATTDQHWLQPSEANV